MPSSDNANPAQVSVPSDSSAPIHVNTPSCRCPAAPSRWAAPLLPPSAKTTSTFFTASDALGGVRVLESGGLVVVVGDCEGGVEGAVAEAT